MARSRRIITEIGLTAAAVVGVACVAIAVAGFALDVKPLIFRSGSMAPAIPTGSLALARTVPADQLAVGDVVSVSRSDGVRVTHRIVSSRPAPGGGVELVLQGDANAEADPQPYTVSEADRVIWSAPYLGRWLVTLQSTPVVFGAGILVGLVLRTLGRPQPRRDDPEDHHPEDHDDAPEDHDEDRRTRAEDEAGPAASDLVMARPEPR